MKFRSTLKHIALFIIGFSLLTACGLIDRKKEVELANFTPSFNQDNAYSHIESQLRFGPRVPQSKAHKLCRNFIQKHLMTLGFQVSSEQSIKQAGYGLITITNIMASYKAEKPTKKILFATHYDTRYTSIDSIPEAIPGANDGASGTAVLLELARIIAKDSVNFDIDFVFFDGQDQGNDKFLKTWCLGSNRWVKTTKNEYDYGIVLDMVGAKEATFAKETFSSYFCKDLQEQIWNIAEELNYDAYFPQDNIVEELINDHYFINNLSKSKIPTLLIADYNSAKKEYFPQWHSKADDIEVIDTKTLKVIGQTLTELLYLPQ